MSDETTSTALRWRYTNDILATLLVCFAIGASIYTLYERGTVPTWLQVINALAILTAVVWAFGGGAARVAGRMLNGGNDG